MFSRKTIELAIEVLRYRQIEQREWLSSRANSTRYKGVIENIKNCSIAVTELESELKKMDEEK